jgi:hypothetical protein
MTNNTNNSDTGKSRIRIGRPSPAMAVSLVALFVALTGTAFAVEVGSIASKHVKDDSLKSEDLKDDAAVTGSDVMTNSLDASDLGPDSVTPSELKQDTVSGSKVIDNTLGSGDIGAGAVENSELGVVNTRLGDVVQIGSAGTPENGDGATAIATAQCSPGEELLSGGARFGGEEPGSDLAIVELDVDSSTDTVTAVGNNDMYSSISFRAIALCLTA